MCTVPIYIVIRAAGSRFYELLSKIVEWMDTPWTVMTARAPARKLVYLGMGKCSQIEGELSVVTFFEKAIILGGQSLLWGHYHLVGF